MINNNKSSVKKLQVYSQLFYVAVYATLACFYGVQSVGNDMPQCTYRMYTKQYNITEKYETLFTMGFVVYLMACACHSAILFGLIKSKYKV